MPKGADWLDVAHYENAVWYAASSGHERHAHQYQQQQQRLSSDIAAHNERRIISMRSYNSTRKTMSICQPSHQVSANTQVLQPQASSFKIGTMGVMSVSRTTFEPSTSISGFVLD